MDEQKQQDPEDDPLQLANELLESSEDRTLSPRADAMEGAPGPAGNVEQLDGQLGPDEISEPEEVIRNNEAKLHH